MKLFLLTLLLTVYCLLLPSPILAHMVGQPPFLKINGKFTDYYPVPSTSLENFPLPQDKTLENFLVKQNINFEIDTTAVQVPAEIVKQTKFEWDFGDGSKQIGVNVSHSYSKMGSYITSLSAHSPDSPQPILLQTTLLNILPSKNYQLPKARLIINGWESKDPLTDIYQSDLQGSFQFDGSKSESFNSQIVEYFWDFGDQESVMGAQTTHRYNLSSGSFAPIFFPLLRIKTQAGFISDNFAQISKGSPTITTLPTNQSGGSPSSPSSSWFIISVAVLAGLIGIIGTVLAVRKIISQK